MPGMGGGGGSGPTFNFGGMGGMPNMQQSSRSGGGGFPGGFGAGGMPGGFDMDTGGPSHSAPPAPSELIKPLALTLEEMYSGTTKRLKLTRKLARGGQEEKILTIPVKAGWKAGTKVRFAESGNEEIKDGHIVTQTIVFVVEEKPHERFTREGDNLVCKHKIPLVEALTGPASQTVTVKHIDGRQIRVPLPSGVLKPGQEITLPKEGFRGKDLIVRIEVVFPDRVKDKAKVKEALS